MRFFGGKPEAEGLSEKNLEGAFSQIIRELFYPKTPEAFTVFIRLMKSCSSFQLKIFQTE